MRKSHISQTPKLDLKMTVAVAITLIGLLFTTFSSVFAQSELNYIAVNNAVVKEDPVVVKNSDIVKISIKKDDRAVKISFAGKEYEVFEDGENRFTLLSLQDMSDGLYPVTLLVDGREENTLATLKIGEDVSDSTVPKVTSGKSIYSLAILSVFVLVIVAIFLSKCPKEDENNTSK